MRMKYISIYNIKLFIVSFLCMSYSYALSHLEGKEHMELFIHQDIINQFLISIGKIEGAGKTTLFEYNWSVSKPMVTINTEKAEFTAKIKLKAGTFERNDLIIGNVIVKYNEEENLIYVKVDRPNIDIDVSDIFSVLPEDLAIINIDLSEYFAEPFKIEAPQPKTAFYEIPMLNDSIRVITINNKETELYLIKDGIKIISVFECISN